MLTILDYYDIYQNFSFGGLSIYSRWINLSSFYYCIFEGFVFLYRLILDSTLSPILPANE